MVLLHAKHKAVSLKVANSVVHKDNVDNFRVIYILKVTYKIEHVLNGCV